jgi:hypothetical protein
MKKQPLVSVSYRCMLHENDDEPDVQNGVWSLPRNRQLLH